MVAIIIVSYNTPWHLKLCLESLFSHTMDFHLFLVSNSQDDKSLNVISNFKAKYPNEITVIKNDKNLGFVGGVNSAYSEAIKFDKVCLLNSDTIVTSNWLSTLNSELEANNLIMISPDTNAYYEKSRFWKVVSTLPFGMSKLYKYNLKFNPPKSYTKDENFKEIKTYEYENFYKFAGGFCSLFYTEHFKDLGYFLDPNIIHGYWDDFDISMYLKQFGKVGWTNKAYVFHFVNASFKKINDSKKDLKKLLHFYNGLYVMKKWEKKIQPELEKMKLNDIYARTDSYVVNMALNYFALKDFKKDLGKFIDSIPAKELGEEFLK